MRYLPGCLSLIALLAACSSAPSDPATDDSPTYGAVLVLADQDLRSVLENEHKMFESIYRDAKLEIRYLPEGELAKAMLEDSVRSVFAYFLPGADQEAYLKSRSLSPHIEAVATDAVAVVISKSSPIDSLSMEDLRAMLAGTGGPVALFDSRASGVTRSLIDSLLQGNASLLRNAVAVEGPEALVGRIAADTTTIGFLSFSLISDLDNPTHRALRDQVKLLRISGVHGTPALLPTQGTLADGHYPLRRSVYMIVTEGKSGLGTGFASFVAGHKGQRIILKLGIAPAHVPAREVMIVTQ
ncbi:MAG: substrate-binding domain-containing protein [Flavobacteriales bacterium]